MLTTENHGLERPTAAELVDDLTMVLPENAVDSLLSRARCDLGLSVRLDAIGSAEFLDLAHLLTRQRGVTALIARSSMTRLSSYSELAERTEHV